MVREEGLEPSILAAADFKSAVYTIPPLSYLVQPVGIEPTSTVLQTAAMTTSAKVALVPHPRFERGELLLLRETTLPDLSSGASLGVKSGIEPCLTVSQTVVQPLH